MFYNLKHPIKIDALEAKSSIDPVVKQLPFAPRRPTPIGNPNNFLDDDTIGVAESCKLVLCNPLVYFSFIIFSIVCIDYPINIDALVATSTTDPVVKQSPFVPRRSKPYVDPSILLDKPKKKNKTRASKHILNLSFI